MLDANDLVVAIKKAASEAVEANQPSDFCFGKVTSTNPLKILVEQKMTLGSAQLVLTRNVTDFSTKVTIDWTTKSKLSKHAHSLKGNTESANAHIHALSGETEEVDLAHTHALTGTKEITIHNALQIGDEVILLKKKGGQKYLVLDRVVKT